MTLRKARPMGLAEKVLVLERALLRAQGFAQAVGDKSGFELADRARKLEAYLTRVLGGGVRRGP